MGHISDQEIDAMIASEERYDAMRRVKTPAAVRKNIDRTLELQAKAEAAQPMLFFVPPKDWSQTTAPADAPLTPKDWSTTSQDKPRDIKPLQDRSNERNRER